MTYRITNSCGCFLLLMTLICNYQCSDMFVNEKAHPEDIAHEWNTTENFIPSGEKQLNVQGRTRPNTEEASVNTVGIIKNRGYPFETHSVTTNDGYILELHRIPYGKKMAPKVSGRPVFLQHGLMSSDNVWLLLPDALAYTLADAGYDVWMGNARGNTYSRRHVSLDPSKEEYWNFSFDEMGNYDIPAIIDFVLTTTGSQKMSYVGHSMGCTMFFICMSLHPELNDKIDMMIALAPAVSMAESTAPLIVNQAPFSAQIKLQWVLDMIGVRAYQPVDSVWNNLRKRYCGPNLFLRYSLCQNTLFSSSGDDYHTIDLNLLPIIDEHNPAGTSVNTALHYAQNYMAGQIFQRFDFGRQENQLRYGKTTPPTYDLSKVTSNVFIFWGQNDKVSAPKDIAWLEPKLGNLKNSVMVEDPLWNHFSFLFSTDAKRLVYDKLIQLLPQPTL